MIIRGGYDSDGAVMVRCIYSDGTVMQCRIIFMAMITLNAVTYGVGMGLYIYDRGIGLGRGEIGRGLLPWFSPQGQPWIAVSGPPPPVHHTHHDAVKCVSFYALHACVYAWWCSWSSGALRNAA